MSGRLRWWTVVPAGVGAALLLIVATAQLTLLNSQYDARAVARTDAYERIYTEVVPAPVVQQAIHDALADVPVDATLLTANIRLLLPPDVLEQVVERALRAFVGYVFGASGRIDTTAALLPVAENVTTLATALLPGVVNGRPAITASTVTSFRTAFERYVADVQAGHVPKSLPTLPLDASTSATVASVVTQWLNEPERDRLRASVDALVRRGDVAGAITVVTQAYASQTPDLPDRIAAGLTRWPALSEEPVHRVERDKTVRSLRAVHAVLPLGFWSMGIAGGLLLTGAIGVAVLGARRRDRGWVIPVAVHFTVASCAAGGIGYLLGRSLPDPLRDMSRDPSIPPAFGAILFDVDRELRSGVASTYLKLVFVLAGVAAVFALFALLPRLRRRFAAIAAHPSLVAGSVAGVILIGVLAALPRPPGNTARTCNGYESLCKRTYDSVTYLAAHNAMASSDQGFINAAQDPDMIGQLDNGVRTLLIDLHYWTTPSEVADFLATQPAATRAALTPSLTPLEFRPGVWLCHVVCQLGATPAVDALHGLAAWLAHHPDAVLTLIVEDHVAEDDVRAVLEQSGLSAYARRPPPIGTPWPTLGEMVRSDKRLFVFTENARPAEGWLSNFYERAAETPFRATSPAGLVCARGRGPSTAALFLLNNWVSAVAPSRALAARVNPPDRLLARVQRCQRERGMRPTFIAVDFAQIGNPLAAVDRLNGVR